MKKLLLFSLINLFILSCKKNDISTDPVYYGKKWVDTVFFTLYTNATITGYVIDENDLPVSDARVFITKDKYVLTDSKGYFVFSQEGFNKNAAWLLVRKEGYFTGSKTILPAGLSLCINKVKIKIEKTGAITNFEAPAGGRVTYANGGEILFPPNALQDVSGGIYTEKVSVLPRYIDPSLSTTTDIAPGMLRGITIDNRVRFMKSYSMVEVFIKDKLSNTINIAPGKKATIKFPIPVSLQSTAPATIKMWYFDFPKGMWLEEGTARKEGESYVGEVSHFSFWSCAESISVANFNLKVNSNKNLPIVGLSVSFQLASNHEIRTAITDLGGLAEGQIPLNNRLTLRIRSVGGTILYEKLIDPVSTNIDLGTVSLNIEAPADDLSDGWSRIKVSNNGISDVYFKTPQLGYAIGDKTYKSVDRGNSWTALPENPVFDSMAGINLNMSDANNVFAVLGLKKQQSITSVYKVNIGTSLLEKIPFSRITNISDVYFINANEGYAVSDSLFYTSDGGKTWSAVSRITDNANISYGNGYRELYFINKVTGWVKFSQNGKYLFRTTNGGGTWEKLNLPPEIEDGFSVDFKSAPLGFMSSSKGILKASDYGNFWNISVPIPDGESFQISDVWFVNATVGYFSHYKHIFKTVDGGKSWFPVVALGRGAITELMFSDENHGWACTTNGDIIKYEK